MALHESSSDSCDDELKPSECASISFQRRFGVPGFEIETHDSEDAFCLENSITLKDLLVGAWSSVDGYSL